MSIQNLIINGSFETGTLSSWTSANTTVTSQFSHSGSFSARFQSSPFTSYIGQFVPLNPGERMEVLASFAKVGTAPSTPVFIQVTFYDSLSNFLGAGLGTTIPVDHIPTADNDTWLEIYQTTTPAPPNTTQAFILIYTSPQAGTANVLVDDVALLIAPDTGVTGATGATGASPSVIPFASGTPVTLINDATGIDQGAHIGFGSSANVPVSAPNTITIGVGGINADFAFIVPRFGTLTSMSAFFHTLSVSPPQPQPQIRARLFRATGSSNIFNQVIQLTLSPPAFSPGTNSDANAAINVPIAAGDKLLMVFDILPNLTSSFTINGLVSAGITIA